MLREGGDAHADSMDWLNVAAMAVNEENAGGGRVVTAPTNGAAGIVPAVMLSALRYSPGMDDPNVGRRSGAESADGGRIGRVVKERELISAPSRLSGRGRDGVLDGGGRAGQVARRSPRAGRECRRDRHRARPRSRMRCDRRPRADSVHRAQRHRGGEGGRRRRVALDGDPIHRVSLDQAMGTMRRTGMDMHEYTETSLGRLAVNVPECEGCRGSGRRANAVVGVVRLRRWVGDRDDVGHPIVAVVPSMSSRGGDRPSPILDGRVIGAVVVSSWVQVEPERRGLASSCRSVENSNVSTRCGSIRLAPDPGHRSGPESQPLSRQPRRPVRRPEMRRGFAMLGGRSAGDGILDRGRMVENPGVG